MTLDRPYRKAMSQAEALRERGRGAGTQFDPHLVELFITTIEAEGDRADAGVVSQAAGAAESRR
jgi:HD-GYP domain-containing protein (c-di-GMP phosphodiesterase class II)